MSMTSGSRNPVLPLETPMLTALLAQTLANATLSNRCRQDRASALRALAKAFDKRLEEIPADASFLRSRMAGFNPAMAGLTPTRWINIKSLVRAALRDAGLPHVPGRYIEPLMPEWATLFAALSNPMMRFGLSRLGRYCSTKGIRPVSIDDQVLAAFYSDMEAGGLGKDPRSVHRTACRVWNKAAATIPGWPSQQVTVPNYTRGYAVPWDQLPATLAADIEAYLKHLAGHDIFAETDFKPLRPASIATRRRQLHGFISALIRTGHPMDEIRLLADIVQSGKVKDGLRFIMAHARQIARKPDPDSGRVHACSTARALMAVARHWVKADETTVAELQTICRKLNPAQKGLRDENRSRLRQFNDAEAVNHLVTLPPRLLSKIRGHKKPSRKDALLVQLAVVVELLLMAPVRLKNLAGLAIGRNLLRSRKGVWQIAIPGDEAKNGSPIDTILPIETGRLLDTYVQTYRPLLLNGMSDWLFPGRYEGKPKSGDMLRHQIIQGVAKHTGLKVNPHLFRHIGAKTYLEAHPGAYGVVRLVLGHKSMNTTIQNYCGTESAHAFAHFDAHILKLREQAMKPTGPGLGHDD